MTDDDFQAETSPENMIFKYAWLLILIFIWFAARPSQTMLTVGNYDLMLCLIILGYAMAKMTDRLMKYYSPYFISDLVKTSTVSYFDEMGIYAVFTIGDKNCSLWPLERGKEGTVIVPKTTITYRGKNVDCGAPLNRIDANEIPPSIRQRILENTDLHPPYYLGYADASLIRTVPKVTFIIEELKMLRKIVNVQEDFIRKRLKGTEELVQYMTRVNQLVKETATDKIKRIVKGEANE